MNEEGGESPGEESDPMRPAVVCFPCALAHGRGEAEADAEQKEERRRVSKQARLLMERVQFK